MTIETCATGLCKCSMGLIPALFLVLPDKRVLTEMKPAANIMDNKLGVNFMPPVSTFGQCLSLVNPDTLSKTIAAEGVLTPGMCTPIFVTPWIPGSFNVLIGSMPALGMTSQLICAYIGVVSFIIPGEFTTQVPM